MNGNCTALHHGGRLRQAAHDHGIALEHWLDLSTGINPQGWPVPPLPAQVWQRLPEDDDGLHEAAAAYYGTAHLRPCAGSQQAIQALPQLRAPGWVGMLQPSYAEHAHAWRRAGHTVIPLQADTIEAQIDALDVLLLVHPNNPTGTRFAPAQLLDWHTRLAARGGWLVVDEAFMDATPQHSIAMESGVAGLIVLRSLGKFFGLAGVRVGFVLAWPQLLQRLAAMFGPWAVSHPAREVARLALLDTAWQEAMRAQLLRHGARLQTLLTQARFAPHGGSALFQYLRHADAARIHHALAQQGILVRRFEQPDALRFGLPGAEAEWQRLEAALFSVGAHSVGERATASP
ncbi:MAG: threonine-phosphate decarboxylase [Gammaproteobacteria bacterium HGW-Gammaproteobacteria-1]|jgi:cobalamin biosynthetic protein CobC|nr:MAG: threonine-phosphate decarboxylase [Gammaproteobacteria bacterium HGW-Gammaproteobacteria-1]